MPAVITLIEVEARDLCDLPPLVWEVCLVLAEAQYEAGCACCDLAAVLARGF